MDASSSSSCGSCFLWVALASAVRGLRGCGFCVREREQKNLGSGASTPTIAARGCDAETAPRQPGQPAGIHLILPHPLLATFG